MGNLFLPYLEKMQVKDKESEDILFALQPIKDPIPVWIFEFIKSDARNWKIRLHPKRLYLLDGIQREVF